MGGLVAIVTATMVFGVTNMFNEKSQNPKVHPKANDGHGNVLLTGTATYDLPLIVAPVMTNEELARVDKFRVTVLDPEVSGNVIASFNSSLTKINSAEPKPVPGAVPGAGARAGAAESAGRRLTHGLYEHGLHALGSWCAPLPSMGLGPFLFFGLLFSCTATRPRLRGYDASNSNPSRVHSSRTGIASTRRWLILGWLAFASGFRLPEDNGVAQIGAGVELAHGSPHSSYESTISGEVDGARNRRQLASGSSCDSSWCVSPPRLWYEPTPPLCNPFAAFHAAMEQPVMVPVAAIAAFAFLVGVRAAVTAMPAAKIPTVTTIVTPAAPAVKHSAPPMLVRSICAIQMDFPRAIRATCIAIPAVTATQPVAIQMVAIPPPQSIANAAGCKFRPGLCGRNPGPSCPWSYAAWEPATPSSLPRLAVFNHRRHLQ